MTNKSDKLNCTATTSERLKQAMALRKVKQIDIVRQTGIDKGSISHYVSGSYEPKKDSVCKIAKALNVNELWLWGYDAPMERTDRQDEKNQNEELCDAILNNKQLVEALKIFLKMTDEQQQSIINLIQAIGKNI